MIPWVLVLLALLAAPAATGLQTSSDEASVCARLCPNRQPECPTPCPACPECPACPAPHCPACPAPHCPPLPPIPTPHCPSLPDLPACPAPVVNLACPPLTCSCPTCPACPPPAPKCPSPPRVIPPGYVTVPGLGSYKIFEERRKWLDANVTCSLDGGYLAVPNTPGELAHLSRMMETYSIKYMHIGFHDTFHENEFLTVIGHPMDAVQRSFWNEGEPNGGRQHNCVYLHKEKQRILDEPCTDSEPFACKIPHI